MNDPATPTDMSIEADNNRDTGENTDTNVKGGSDRDTDSGSGEDLGGNVEIDVDTEVNADVDSALDVPGDSDSDRESDDDDDDSSTAEKDVCGDGELTFDEACDDGNTDNGDGCTGDCLEVEDGWSCIPPGKPCHRMARCGDGQAMLPEMCDDGNIINEDGCSSSCQLETGYKCEGEPSQCTEVTCGDSNQEGTETCDDGNTRSFDGCNAVCRIEPQCPVGAACISSCGDGILYGEEACDDGNSISGDGCSDACDIERGFTCEQKISQGEEMILPMILRDFEANHNDFKFEAEKEEDLAFGLVDATFGLVETLLSDDKTPILTRAAASTDAQLVDNGLIHSPGSFDSWYRNADDKDATVVSALILFDDDGDGRYVNRYTDSGDRWERLGKEYEGTPMFFPLDNLGITPRSAYDVARIPPNYFGLPEGSAVDDACNLGEGCNPCRPLECIEGDSRDKGDCVDEDAGETLEDYACYDDSPRHNFHFTTQVGTWFQYDASRDHTIGFVGDDDLWVFVNGQLVLDLGGIHTTLGDEVTLNNLLDLEDGVMYELMVFHAKRQTHVSTFKLTLSGFSTLRSRCEPVCGDGILSPGEECDDGENNGGKYTQCTSGCVLSSILSELCGDGIVQEEYEDCDDGNFDNDDDCPSSCQLIDIDM